MGYKNINLTREQYQYLLGIQKAIEEGSEIVPKLGASHDFIQSVRMLISTILQNGYYHGASKSTLNTSVRKLAETIRNIEHQEFVKKYQKIKTNEQSLSERSKQIAEMEMNRFLMNNPKPRKINL